MRLESCDNVRGAREIEICVHTLLRSFRYRSFWICGDVLCVNTKIVTEMLKIVAELNIMQQMNQMNRIWVHSVCVCVYTTHVNNHRRNHCHPQQWEMFKVSSFEEYEMLNRFDNLLLLCLYTMRKWWRLPRHSFACNFVVGSAGCCVFLFLSPLKQRHYV